MKSAKQTQYFATVSVCFYFDKNARSFLHTYSGARSLFGDNRAVRFQCVSFGWRTFYFYYLFWRCVYEKNT